MRDVREFEAQKRRLNADSMTCNQIHQIKSIGICKPKLGFVRKSDMQSAIISPVKIDHIIADAWADEISFDEIKRKHGLSEAEVILVMRSNLKAGSFRAWRERVSGRKSKHLKRMRQLTKAEPLVY